MARDILAVPTPTVASESTFSVGRMVIDESRASLLPDAIEVIQNASSPEHAEILPALMAVRISQELPLKGFALERDARVLIKEIQSDQPSLSPLGPLVEDFKALLYVTVVDANSMFLLDAKSRTLDPQRLIRAYYQDAPTINLLRAFATKG
ncbi:hypothetical protein ACH5RR_032716 [Cinchona calisaya]|uniref:HAT C-terminal dimerisation domain-containing protein n=1 Tax=Cinchona calisaya TaxID=153742 RepID=A0ABD2YLC7_9GENT